MKREKEIRRAKEEEEEEDRNKYRDVALCSLQDTHLYTGGVKRKAYIMRIWFRAKEKQGKQMNE